MLGCATKVFVQLEIGKYTILTGKTTLDSLGNLPGWKPFRLHWIAWMALLMFLGGIGQMGGVVGGVGQSLSIAFPITEEGAAFNEAADAQVRSSLEAALSSSGRELEADFLKDDLPHLSVAEGTLTSGLDPYVWALLVSLLTVAILVFGRYGLIEKLVTLLVIGFTLVSVANFVLLQQQEFWAVRWSDLWSGLQFRLPPRAVDAYPVATALAAFGIIGMAAGELIFYPYWCLEKGYASHVGPHDDTPAWNVRARGWIKVMHWDAWCSMVVYTVSTVVFYLLGASILGRAGLRPDGMELIRTLSAMYEPVFGEWASSLFLIGSVAVLFSTFFVNNASSALVWADAAFRVGSHSRRSFHKLLCVALPLTAFGLFCLVPNPRGWVIFAGMTQTLMLPLLGYAAIRFRFSREADLFRSSRWGSVLLVTSAFALLLAGGWHC